ncbi:MAG: hypothetical protein BWZ10_00760 [candidate division BRC1 bacterium ADurb.BinA364]|nr:MAG: hypothetical protein BWZ10_00760 [candidate division BRC1 bacterium ADurb.BinA364]
MERTPLDDVEIRVLGALIEKHLATPEYYPLSLNALQNACNQKTSREPVVSYDEDTILDALERLRTKGMALRVSIGGGRVPKHRHALDEKWGLQRSELAILAVLLLRGAQTLGEIRSRTGRMADFGSLDQAQEALDRLARWDGGPLVVRLPRQPGRSENRFAHALDGRAQEGEWADPGQADGAAEQYPLPAVSHPAAAALVSRVEQLETDVAALREELRDMRQALGDFRRQFE